MRCRDKNCKNDTIHPKIGICWEHKYEDKYCTNLKKDKLNVCGQHILCCYRYKNGHRCSSYVKSGEYCKTHKCLHCNLGIDTCKRHKCLDCEETTEIGSKYCLNHKCSKIYCPNKGEINNMCPSCNLTYCIHGESKRLECKKCMIDEVSYIPPK